jgi:tetratricopeptide (TPR) repeat protein
MKCPSCGAQMKEGTLYCENCGEEIHIVPDFEPELEEAWQKTIDTIAEDIREEKSEEDAASGYDDSKDTGYHAVSLKRRIPVICAVIVIFVIIAGTVTTVSLYFSEKFQTSRARSYASDGQYDKAIKYYNRAIELDDENVTLKVELADAYFHKNNKMEYEYLLRDIVKDENASEEQIESAYGKLIAIYRSREDYQSINDFLQASGNAKVLSLYQGYVAMDPEFSIKDGYYTSIQPLKITASGKGKIYYTMNGEDPDTDSTQYTTPILLENGDYVIKAYYVIENGIYSNVVTGTYHIEIDELPIPDISVLSGEYNFPINIEILDDAENVYYTTDGSTPTEESKLYTAPIPMPVGNSTFKFIRIDAGMSSAVEERQYQLTLNTDFTPEDAVDKVMEYCMEKGKIYDEQGHFDESSASYVYQYQYVTNINDIDDFYVIMEILRGTDKSLTITGTYYAVNAYTGELYKLLINDSNYTLVEIEKNSHE